jgi:hypothetical protein
MGVSSRELIGFGLKSRFHCPLEIPEQGMTPHRDLMILYGSPDRLDLREFGAVAGQVDEVDVRGLEERLGFYDGLTVMDRIVIQQDHQGTLPLPFSFFSFSLFRGFGQTRRPSRQLPEEGEHPIGIELPHLLDVEAMILSPLLPRLPGVLGFALGEARPRLELEAPGAGAVREIPADDIDPATARRLIGDLKRLPDGGPTVARGRGGSKPRLIDMTDVDQPGPGTGPSLRSPRPFSKRANSAAFSPTA